MATSKTVELGATYVQITTQTDFFIQNIGANYSTIEICYKDTAPAETDRGFILNWLSVINSGIIGGKAWARCSTGTGLVSVTE